VLENSNPPFPSYQTLQQFLIPYDKGKTLLVYVAVNNFKGKNIKAIHPTKFVFSSSQTSNTGL